MSMFAKLWQIFINKGVDDVVAAHSAAVFQNLHAAGDSANFAQVVNL